MPPELVPAEGPAVLTWPPLALAIALHVLILLIAVWDLYVAFGPGSEYSVTAIVQGWVTRSAALAYAAGFVAGHVFWGRMMSGPRGG